ncbi:MAG: toll/interleukin-1 receptor domain-containing protein [Anaerolineae bacterium]|nr:toll/interleukin-1 receptor domain-containing protein [Anaerolineae bacterium]
MSNSRDDERNALIAEHWRRLHLLKLRQAREGGTVDPGVVIEIENIEKEISALQRPAMDTEAVSPAPETAAPQPAPPAAGPYHSCFISYSHQDEAFAQKLYADLLGAGVTCWFAPEDLKIGSRLRDAFDQAIPAHNKLLLILSAHSVASDWVEHEVETAFEQERERQAVILFPIRLDETVFEVTAGWAAHIRRTRHIGDFRRWQDSEAAYQTSLRRLLRDLRLNQ